MTGTDVLDLVTPQGSGYRDLYYRWEREQWEAGAIELEADRAGWEELDPFERRHLADAVNWRRVKAQLAAEALVPFVDAAPSEEQQVFLTTQLADEARAGIFLDRVATEVLGETGDDMETRSAAAAATVDPTLGSLLIETLSSAAGRLRGASDPGAELVRAVTGYHLGVVGMLGLTELRALLSGSGPAQAVTGVARGLALMERDSIRHVAFALLFLEETAEAGPGATYFEAALDAALPRTMASVSAMASSAPGLGSSEELRSRAAQELTAWLRAVKLKVPALT